MRWDLWTLPTRTFLEFCGMDPGQREWGEEPRELGNLSVEIAINGGYQYLLSFLPPSLGICTISNQNFSFGTIQIEKKLDKPTHTLWHSSVGKKWDFGIMSEAFYIQFIKKSVPLEG